MWVVYNGTDGVENDTARQIEWAVIARSYAFALRSHERRDAPGETPILMKVVEANTSKYPESTYEFSSGIARLFAYGNISSEVYGQKLLRSLRSTTESEQRRARKIDKDDRNITFYPNGTKKYMEPPKFGGTDGNTTGESTTTSDNRFVSPPVASRRSG